MKILVQAMLVFCFCSILCVGQENDSVHEVTPPVEGFDWLRQFEGTWDIKSKNAGAEEDNGKDEHAGSATMTSRVVGSQWVISKQVGEVGGMSFEALQTVGYDVEKKQYFGTWVDSTSNYTWNLKGTLDETGKKLTLGSEGKDWSDPTKTRQYRDVYEFASKGEIATVSQMKGDDGKWTTFMSSKMTRREEKQAVKTTRPTVTPFLMFTGKAEEAIEFYRTILPAVKVESMVKFKAGEAGKEGSVQVAHFEIAGQRVMCTDSPPVHDFTFTPSFSFFVECESLESLKERFEKLSEGGKVMMPVGEYGFSDQFGWCSDKYGVSWQLNLNLKSK